MTKTGEMLGEYDIPTSGSGARCIMHHSNGRLYFTQYDSGGIGEVVPLQS
jgi:hypothetical protein